MGPGDITIVVLNWNRADETIACLESLWQADLGGAKVLVVDNGSRDASVAMIRQSRLAHRLLTLPENRGYAGGNNAGIETALAAGAKAVLVLNNDTRVAPDFLMPLVWVLESNPKIAAVSSAILRLDRPEILDVAYLELHFGHGLVHRRGVNALPGEGFDTCRAVEVAVGCSLLMRAEALRTVGLFDEAYFAYHEEVDWCFRARKAGFEVCYQPLSRVWHRGSKSTENLGRAVVGSRIDSPLSPQLPSSVPLSWSPVRAYFGARNAVRFVWRHCGWLTKLYFLASSAYAVPLELLATVLRREEALQLGKWSYRRAVSTVCFESEGGEYLRHAGLVRRLLAAVRALLWTLPRDIRRAHRDGRTAQTMEHLRGLWDGLRNRPLPLERLQLR